MNTVFTTDDGNTIEAIVEGPESPRGTVVLCHPHPLHGGTMRAPLLIAVAGRATDAGYRVVRFNFRGVGGSTGEFGNGVDEATDVDAAVGFADRFPEPVVGICGWSFGAATALRWQSDARSRLTYVGIAPPVANPLTPSLPGASTLAQASRHFIVGERDQFVPVEGLESYAASIGASITVIRATDHFFIFRYDQLADAVVAALGG